MGKCKSKCMETGTIMDGGRLMVAKHGNEKFKEGEKHKQCDDCVKEMMAEAEKYLNKKERPSLTELKDFFVKEVESKK